MGCGVGGRISACQGGAYRVTRFVLFSSRQTVRKSGSPFPEKRRHRQISNVESEPRWRLLDAVARSIEQGRAITIRVTPIVDAKTHARLPQASSENQVRHPIARATRKSTAMGRRDAQGWRFRGHRCLHIGSQLTD